MKTINLREILHKSEWHRAVNIYNENKGGNVAKKLKDEIIMPAMERINNKTGQDNDPLCMAYALEYTLMSSKSRGFV